MTPTKDKRYQGPPGWPLPSDIANKELPEDLVQQVVYGLTHVEKKLEDWGWTSGQKGLLVTESLAHLKAAAHLLGGRDWLYLDLGVFCSIGVILKLDPQGMDDLWKLLGAALRGTVNQFPREKQRGH